MAPILLQDEALAIVACWREKLLGCGSVTISKRPTIAAVDASTATWLEIAVNDVVFTPENEELAWANLRDAVDILHALSRCAGYAPHLNVSFWQEVLQAAGVTERPQDLLCAVLDGDFPRFRLTFPRLENNGVGPEREASLITSALHRFFHLHSQYQPRDVAFTTTMERLRSFESPSRRIPLEISLALPSMDTQWLLPVVTALSTDLAAHPEINLSEMAVNQRRYRPENPLEGAKWLSNLNEDISRFTHWTIDDAIDDPLVYGELNRRVLGLGDSESAAAAVACIRTLRVDRSSLSDAQFAALCSALPFTRSVETLRIYVDPDWNWNALSSKHDWAWLSYALFHEQTRHSSWRGLCLESCGIDINDAAVVEDVRRRGVAALQEHLDLGSAGGEPTSMVVSVAGGAQLYWPGNAEPFTTLSDPAVFSNQLSSISGSATNGSVPVVVPGYGYVLVDSSDIVGTHRAGSTLDRSSSLHHFCATQDPCHYGSVRGLKRFLHTWGTDIRSLDLIHHQPLHSLDVDEILTVCPRVEAVALNHDGSLWSRRVPRLSDYFRSVRLSCSLLEAYAMVAALFDRTATHPIPNVQALHFDVTRGTSVFPSINKQLGAMLLANPTLVDFTMVQLRPRMASATRMTVDRQWKTLRRMKIAPDDLVETRSSVGTAAVWYDHWMQDIFPRDIVASIVAFAGCGSSTKRRIWIDVV